MLLLLPQPFESKRRQPGIGAQTPRESVDFLVAHLALAQIDADHETIARSTPTWSCCADLPVRTSRGLFK
jgi:hypothetical protein